MLYTVAYSVTLCTAPCLSFQTLALFAANTQCALQIPGGEERQKVLAPNHHFAIQRGNNCVLFWPASQKEIFLPQKFESSLTLSMNQNITLAHYSI
jgi:hypothetical protein